MATAQKPSSAVESNVTTASTSSREAPLQKLARLCIMKINDSNTNDAERLKSLNVMMNHVDKINDHPTCQAFLAVAVPALLEYLDHFDDILNFVRRSTRNRSRKLAIDIIHRLFLSNKKEELKCYVPTIVSGMYKILEKDNEETALQALKIIMEAHRQPRLRPPISEATRKFVSHLKTQFQSIPSKVRTLLEQKTVLRMKSSDINTALGPVIHEICAVTSVLLEVEGGAKTNICLIPKASNSLKVLLELPVITLFMAQLYGESVKAEVLELIPAMATAVAVHPTDIQRSSLTLNKEILVNLMSVQAKIIRFLALLSNLYKDEVQVHGERLVTGVLSLFALCPPEASPLRRDLYTVTCQLLKTELRSHCLPHFEKLLDEDVTLGGGWSVNETMRPLAYKTAFECIHNVGKMLQWGQLLRAILFLCVRLHDDSVPMDIQIMSVKLITCLMDASHLTNKSERDQSTILWRVLEVLVLKFKVVALVHLPHIIGKLKSSQVNSQDGTSSANGGNSEGRSTASSQDSVGSERSEGFLKHFGFPVSRADNLELGDSRNLVKALVTAVKKVTMGISMPTNVTMTEEETQQQPQTHKAFSSSQTEVYLQMIRWGSKALDVFTMEELRLEAYDGALQDEFEVLQEFSSIFYSMNPCTLKLLCGSFIEIFFEQSERTQQSCTGITKKLLENAHTSTILFSSLMQHLIQKMEILGGDAVEKSALHLKLFQLLFESVCRFPTTNGQLFCTKLCELISLAMNLARKSKSPRNYFLLLRDLFTSVCKVNNNLIFMKLLLPILQNLLRDLNRIQRTHDQLEIKNLALDVCLAAPVRYSGTPPYLPQFLDSLLLALKSSPALVTKALKALELLIDNVEAPFFSEHFEPLRADIVPVLWKILRLSTHSDCSGPAFRILGKLGGKNRHMLLHSENLNFHGNHSNITNAQCLLIQFPYHKTNVSLPIEKTIEVAVNTLLDGGNITPNYEVTADTTDDLHYKIQSWEFLKWFVLASVERESDNSVEKRDNVLLHIMISNYTATSSSSGPMQQAQITSKCRDVMVKSLTGWLIATTVKGIQKDVYANLTHLLRYLSVMMVAQQVGPFSEKLVVDWMDPYVLLDAIFNAVICVEKNLRRPVMFAMSVIMNTTINMMDSKEKAFSLPMMDYITKKILSLCYEPTWIAKMGASELLSYFLDNAPATWTLGNLPEILKALLFVLVGLQGQVSAGCVNSAQLNIIKLITALCFIVSSDANHLLEERVEGLSTVLQELIKYIGSPVSHVRKICIQGLELLAELGSAPLSLLMRSEGDLLLETLIPGTGPPLCHQSIECQLGVLEGFTFCLGLQPPTFSLDLNINTHKEFVNALLLLADSEEPPLETTTTQKSVSSQFSLRIAVLSALACVTNISGIHEKIIEIFLKNLMSDNTEVQRCAFECLKKWARVDENLMKNIGSLLVPQYLPKLTPVEQVTSQFVNHLAYLCQLFPEEFNNVNFWKSLLQVFDLGITKIVNGFKKIANPRLNHEVDLCVAVLECFFLLPKSNSLNQDFNFDCVLKLCGSFLSAERWIKLESFYKPMCKFLLNHPLTYAFVYVSITSHVGHPSWTNFFLHFIEQPEAEELRKCFVDNAGLLIKWLSSTNHNNYRYTFTNRENTAPENSSFVVTWNPEQQEHFQYVAIKIVEALHAFDETWIVSDAAVGIFNELKTLWSSPSYQYKISSKYVTTLEPLLTVDGTTLPNTEEEEGPISTKLEAHRWKEPHLTVNLLLEHFKRIPSDYELLFQLILAFCGRPLLRYQFLREFLKGSLPNFSTAWKRQCFYEFCGFCKQKNVGDEQKARIIQLVLIPCFVSCFENGQCDELIVSESGSIVKTFITELIPPPSQEIGDSLRISLFQFSSLLVDQASTHFGRENQNETKHKLIYFGLPTLRQSNFMEISVKFNGILLLSHMYAKFNIDSKLQLPLMLLSSLLKAYSQEAKQVKNQGLDVIIPAILQKLEGGDTHLVNHIRTLLNDDPSLGQTSHLVDLISRQWKLFFSIRHSLCTDLTRVMNQLVSLNTLEAKTIAVDLAQVMLKWELELIVQNPGIQDAGPGQGEKEKTGVSSAPNCNTPLNTSTVESVLTTLMRVACHYNSYKRGCPEALLCTRSVAIYKHSLSPNMWGSKHLNNLKLDWMRGIFSKIDESNITQVCMALYLLTFLICRMSENKAVETLHLFKTEVITCMLCRNPTVIRAIRLLIIQLMKLFPSEFRGHLAPTLTSSSLKPKYEQLAFLQDTVNQVVYQGIVSYVKFDAAKSPVMLGALTMLCACGVNIPGYIDNSKVAVLVKCMEKLVGEHLHGSEGVWTATDLLKSLLELVKNRVHLMNQVVRRTFIEGGLLQLIEKSKDEKIMKMLVTLLGEWMKEEAVVTQGPSLEDKSVLIVKMKDNLEKRFPKNEELTELFLLDVVCSIYQNKQLLNSTELGTQLETAFLRGLCSRKSDIRGKFFQIFERRLKKRLVERLMYIFCDQNWEPVGSHYWIKQCVEIVLVAVQTTNKLELSPQESHVPSLCHQYSMKDLKNMVASLMDVKCEVMEDPEQLRSNQQLDNEIEALEKCKSENEVSEAIEKLVEAFINEGCAKPVDARENLKAILKKDQEWNVVIRKGLNVNTLLKPLVQLCHMDTRLAEHVWKELLHVVWQLFTEGQRAKLVDNAVPFMCSGAHISQQDCSPNAVGTFVDALLQCKPEIPFKPMVARYLGKRYNLWHYMTLHLEQLTYSYGPLTVLKARITPETVELPETLDCLSELYSQLGEEDLWTGLWRKRVKYPATVSALAFEQQGKFDKSRDAYEEAMSQARVELTSRCPTNSEIGELKLLEEHWVKCHKELGHWDVVEKYSLSNPGSNWSMALEAAWQNGDWEKAHEALCEVELPQKEEWKINLFGGFLSFVLSESEVPEAIKVANDHYQKAETLCIREWKRLPSLVSDSHIALLQAIPQIVELQQDTGNNRAVFIEDDDVLKKIWSFIKPWVSRLPSVSDGFAYWSSILNWRTHYLQRISDNVDEETNNSDPSGSTSSSQSQIITFIQSHKSQTLTILGRSARKQNLVDVSLETLERISPTSIFSYLEKLKQKVKCIMKQPIMHRIALIQETLQAMESKNIERFGKTSTAEFMTLKGFLLSQVQLSDDAEEAFSASLQLNNSLAKSWAYWGDHLEQSFINNPSQVAVGTNAIAAFMQACQHRDESKGRKYIAKILWLLMYDDEIGSLAKTVIQHSKEVPPVQWLPWLPQLVGILARGKGNNEMVVNLLNHVGKVYPQAVYLHIRTLFLTLKMQGRIAESSEARTGASQEVVEMDGENSQESSTSQGSNTSDVEEGLKRCQLMQQLCLSIMETQMTNNPIAIPSLDKIMNQLMLMRENWSEGLRNRLKIALATCHNSMFQNSKDPKNAVVSPELRNFLRNVVLQFGKVVVVGDQSAVYKHVPEDPSSLQLQIQLTEDFGQWTPTTSKLTNLVEKLRHWVQLVERNAQSQSGSHTLTNNYLLKFNEQMAEIDLPGEYLKHPQHYVKISRFESKVEVVVQHKSTARRIRIRGDNGKVYPYLVVQNEAYWNAGSEQRVLQMMRMLNPLLAINKQTARRNMQISVPKLVQISPVTRLVEDNQSSITLEDIYKNYCEDKKLDFQKPIRLFYDSLLEIQTKGGQPSHHQLRKIFQCIQGSFAPKIILRNWALNNFASSSDYWMFRKVFTRQICLSAFAEYAFCLTRLNPEMMNLHQDSGRMSVSYFRFRAPDAAGNFDDHQSVPFRLTPTISEFISPFGVHGAVVGGMIALGECLVSSDHKLTAILRALLVDEVDFQLGSGNSDGNIPKNLIQMVNKMVDMHKQRLKSLSKVEEPECMTSTLVAAAMSDDNLCRMDPAWFPWL